MKKSDLSTVELSAHLAALTLAVRESHAIPMGRLFGLPELPGDDCWVDIAGAAALTGTRPRTITSWLARHGPVRNPFPAPRRLLYRLYWPKQEIVAWQAKEASRMIRP